jgi:YidC/Oxa1 family membrane protein insertase
MDQMRLLLALVLSFLVFMGFNMFFGQDAEKKPVAKSAPESAAQIKAESAAPAAAGERKPAMAPAAPAAEAGRPARQIRVETPLYTLGLSETGAAVNRFTLKEFRETAASDSPPKSILPADGSLAALTTALVGESLAGLERALYQAGLDSDVLTVTEGTRDIAFRFDSKNGIQVEKAYRFAADSYVMGLTVRIFNGSDQPLKDSLAVILRKSYADKKNASVFEGPSALIDKSLETIEIDDIGKKNSFSGQIKWIALQSRYFMTSLMPASGESGAMRLEVLPGQVVQARYSGPEQAFGAGESREFQFEMFFGPKSAPAVEKAGHELDRVIDYGFFDILAKPCVWLMNFLYGIIPNYGLAIIILTIFTKIILWPLGTKSYKSMNQMKKLQPLIQEIREKHKGDRKKMNEEVMRLHRTYNINPLGGCLPMVLQIPVFFALYRMLDQAIELRHAPFVWWINDLSAPDRLFNFSFSIPFMEPPYGIPVLTLVMGATMFWQQKMTPPAGDPTQAKMMMLMPVVFTFIFINFSSGLVLYWLINNVLSIGQQMYTQKKFA